MKQTLLIPTDFSNNALVATNYALKLAAYLQANVHILHVYKPFTSAFQSELANKTDAQRAKAGAEKGMKDFLEKLGNQNSAFDSSIIEGNLVDAVGAFVVEKRVDVIVMGTHGASGTRKDWLGSNTYDVAKEIEIPLLIVPEHSVEFTLERSVFFTDYQKNDFKVLKSLLKLLGNDDTPCTLVHVTEQNPEDQKRILVDWSLELANTSGYRTIDTALISSKENLSVVNDTIEQLHADLCLLTLIEGRGFFERFLHKSLARAIIINPKVPVFLTK